MNIKLITVTLSLLIMSGCSSLPMNPYSDLSTEGKMWQVAHIADVAQTIEIARDPICYEESNPVTRRLIGRKPTVAKVVMWGATASYLNAQLDVSINQSSMPKWAKKGIGYLNLGLKVDVVTGNYGIGVRIGAKNKPPSNHHCYRG